MKKQHKTKLFFNVLARNHSRPMQEYVDYDYIRVLINGVKSNNEAYANECKQALEFLDKFSAEYYKGYFHKDKEAIHPDNLRKECYKRNNDNKVDVSSWCYKVDNDVYNDNGYNDRGYDNE